MNSFICTMEEVNFELTSEARDRLYGEIYLKNTGEITTGKTSIFEVQSENCQFYTTWSGNTLYSGEEAIGINGLFANKLGFTHKEQVTIKKLDNVITCQQAIVEPLSVDDWEILELHAEEVERMLLNQVRIVSPGLVFPIWINKSICIFVKIGSVNPSCEYCLLEERTEVHISPKDRPKQKAVPMSNEITTPASCQNSKSTKAKSRKSVTFIDEIEEIKDGTEKAVKNCNNTEPGFLIGLFRSARSCWYSGGAQSAAEGLEEVENLEYLDEEWLCNLRIQPKGQFVQQLHSTDRIPLEILGQTSNVFISHKTFKKCCQSFVNGSHSSDEIQNKTFLAEISKLLSPTEKEDFMKKKLEKIGSRLSDINQNTDRVEKADVDETKLQTKAIVRVIVLDSDRCFVLNSALQEQISAIQLLENHGILDGHVMMSDELRLQLGVYKAGKVVLKALNRKTSCQVKPKKLNIHPLSSLPNGFTSDLLSLAVKSWMRKHCDSQLPLIVSKGLYLRVKLTVDIKQDIVLSFQSDEEDTAADRYQHFITLDPMEMENIRTNVDEEITPENMPSFLTFLPGTTLSDIDPLPIAIDLDNMGGLGTLPSEVLLCIQQSLSTSPLAYSSFNTVPGLSCAGILVTGPRGVGKTSLVRGICKTLAESPACVHVSMLDCKQLRGKRIDNIKKTLQRCLSEAAWRQPSVVVLDDLDLICGSPAGPEQEMSGDAIYFSKVSQLICELIKTEMIEKSSICIVATSKARSSLHQSLATSRGLHYFQADFSLQPPDKEKRLEIITSIIKKITDMSKDMVDNLDLSSVVTKTEGYVARDLQTLVHRAIHAYRMVNTEISSDILLTSENFNVALTGFTPSSLKNVSLHKPGHVGWEDVGGLHDVRNTLTETLQWPSKYPELFANCPLRLRSGILLYGAPGTGKTLLASVVAKECGLNFISIKGPELLSKYIGASEQAVRDTFVRAQSARPCVLFFDEFDSLAPRRGHDSTGVTDRVVNQLLTQLDGVEGLEGVYVLAATSRPDLIDPALLRPGRLDKAIHCGLPKELERLEILRALTRNIHLSKDVQLQHFADICENFTGADFKALLYNSQLEAIHQVHGHNFNASTDNSVLSKITSEGSILSNGSWEQVNIPNKDSESEILTVGGNLEVIATKEVATPCDLRYFSSLRDGMFELTDEAEEQLRDKVIPLLNSTEDDNKHEKASESVIVHHNHLLSALKTMGPSVSKTERMKYQKIYENFVHSKGGNFVDGLQSVGKRATLA